MTKKKRGVTDLVRVKMRIEYTCTKMKDFLKLSLKKGVLGKIFSASETSDAFKL